MSVFSRDLDDIYYTRVRPELLFDIDAMSVKVRPPSSNTQTAHLTKGVKKELKEEHARNVGIIGGQTMKYRCVPYIW